MLLEDLSAFGANALAALMSSNTDILGFFVSGRQNIKTPYRYMTSFTPSAIATHSASVVDKVTLVCVLENHVTDAPPNPIAGPETERLSLGFWA